MKKHYQNVYSEQLAVETLSGTDQSSRCEFAKHNFRPMYYIKMYDQDPTKLEMCFDTTNYQPQFPERVPFEDHVFQTIFLNRQRDGHLWSDGEIDESQIIRTDGWHQLCHRYTYYLFEVPWMMFLQGRRRVRYAGSWTLVNAHEFAVLSGLAAAVDLGAEYPEDLEHDFFAFRCFRLYYLLAYGKWYRRRYTKTAGKKGTSDADALVPSANAEAGLSWATGLHGSRYRGPGVADEERTTWREEFRASRSTEGWLARVELASTI